MAKPNGANHELQGSQNVFPNRQSGAAIGSTQQRETATAVTRETEFSVLPDGRIVDLIRKISQPTNLEFLVWQDGNIQLRSHIEHDGELLVLPKIDPTVVSALRLPTTAKPCPAIGALFMLVMDCIEKYVDIASEYAFLVAAFILTTWFADRLAVVPYLSVCGPPESGKTHATAAFALSLPPCNPRLQHHTRVAVPASRSTAPHLPHR